MRQWGAPRNHNEGGYDQGDSDRYGNDGPQGGGGGGGGRACFRCGDPGHFIADCSQPAPARFGLSAAGDHGYMSFNGSEDVNGFATKTQDSGYGNRRNRPPRIVADDDVPYGGTEKWNTPQEKAEQPNVEEGADQGDHADDGWGEEANDQENGESGHQSPDNSNDVDSNVKEVVDLLTPLTIDRKPHAKHVDDEEEYADADDGEASAEGVLSGADDGLSGWE
ncbi:hypothetical protein IE81DRAFT_158235 [Ceraceosorus guamensis]|uniref:CCHC-type domain-containing protein n=1 Tax=Ceraceosorus guamensis TaxID=1522189 RepID=A0A316W242_9BASI|nr:hypothetical protein IE81DRAFT_158235 [Ceraceosorus guamensis]PWN41745.1 hypothetical protein IE81DRAFT_158235 [Ceraceosorus guamensis]